MTYPQELYADVLTLLRSDTDMLASYRQLGRLLDRMLKERTSEDTIVYHGNSPRIFALCQRHGIGHQALCVLRNNIQRVSRNAYHPQPIDLLFDAKALCQAIEAFYQAPPPQALAELLPNHWRQWESETTETGQHMRFTVSQWDECQIQGYDERGEERTVAYSHEWSLARQLYPLATLNLLDITIDDDGLLHPQFIILEPDYLVDITSVCLCYKESGTTPLHYLISKFQPKEDTPAIQLGNVANQFLDDAVRSNDDFLQSMQKSFRDYPLTYCTLEGIDENFFRQCRQHHRNILHTVRHLFPQAGIDVERDGVMLEPTFICPQLGLQGRMDLLTSDCRAIVELKSGKRDEFHNTFRMEHAWQMALYKEVLHYCLGKPRSEVRTLLLYSRYPELYDIRLGRQAIVEALNARNGIVHIDCQLRLRPHEFLMSLNETDFNPLGSNSKLYKDYIRPNIDGFLHTLHTASPLTFDYFSTMLSFLQREQFHAKVGDDRPDSDRGFAQAWLSDIETKLIHGNIMVQLSLQPVVNDEGMMTHILARFDSDNQGQPNFREGDSVVLYEHNSEADLLSNHQSLRCQIEVFAPDNLLLRLPFPQRDTSFVHSTSHYAIEPSHSDNLFHTQYRGLFGLLTCDDATRNLFLAQWSPSPDGTDYQLLIGPPGSGKTSQTLRHMVWEELEQTDHTLLLMAYTNRAVDEICQMLSSLPGKPAFLRIGQEATCAPDFRPHLLYNYISSCLNRQQLLAAINPVRIVCGTVASLCGSHNLFRLKQFATAYLDEASQVLEPQLLPLLPQLHRFVLIGDHKQLPAVVMQPESASRVSSPALCDIGLTDCRHSLFERLHTLIRQRGYTGIEQMLTHQGRMHVDINNYVSHAYYADQLSIVPLPHQQQPLPWTVNGLSDPLMSRLATQHMVAFDVSNLHPSINNKTNESEAKFCALLVASLHQLYLRSHLPWQPRTGIGIIVPFRGQITLVRHHLHQLSIPQADEITIDTVERYQGSQRDVILFSTVVRQPYQVAMLSAPVESDGQRIDRKLNVAITRARHQFLLIGNLSLLRLSTDYSRLINYCEKGTTVNSPLKED